MSFVQLLVICQISVVWHLCFFVRLTGWLIVVFGVDVVGGGAAVGG
jgi:hypothetical protein